MIFPKDARSFIDDYPKPQQECLFQNTSDGNYVTYGARHYKRHGKRHHPASAHGVLDLRISKQMRWPAGRVTMEKAFVFADEHYHWHMDEFVRHNQREGRDVSRVDDAAHSWLRRTTLAVTTYACNGGGWCLLYLRETYVGPILCKLMVLAIQSVPYNSERTNHQWADGRGSTQHAMPGVWHPPTQH